MAKLPRPLEVLARHNAATEEDRAAYCQLQSKVRLVLESFFQRGFLESFVPFGTIGRAGNGDLQFSLAQLQILEELREAGWDPYLYLAPGADNTADVLYVRIRSALTSYSRPAIQALSRDLETVLQSRLPLWEGDGDGRLPSATSDIPSRGA